MKKSALSVALSSKPGELPQPAEKKDVDNFSFPCLTPSGSKADNSFDDEFERMSLSDSRHLAGSISNAVRLPNGSLAVSIPCFFAGILMPQFQHWCTCTASTPPVTLFSRPNMAVHACKVETRKSHLLGQK